MCYRKVTAVVAVLLLIGGAAFATGTEESRVLHIYTAFDTEEAQYYIEAFEAETGITVKPVYDDEAVKTVGLVNRLIAEHKSKSVRCDVFWNSETSRALLLKKRGATEAYASPSAKDIPVSWP